MFTVTLTNEQGDVILVLERALMVRQVSYETRIKVTLDTGETTVKTYSPALFVNIG